MGHQRAVARASRAPSARARRRASSASSARKAQDLASRRDRSRSTCRARPARRFDYYKDPAKTESSFDGEHFTLGDVGYLDEDGWLFLTDRSANLIISGGVNIYPAEVEAELLGHPAVGDAAVIGVPDDDWGEIVLAVVEPQPGVDPTDALAAELVAFCRDRLAHYKCPRRVDFTDELPRHDNGKLYKRLIRDQYREAAEAAKG